MKIAILTEIEILAILDRVLLRVSHFNLIVCVSILLKILPLLNKIIFPLPCEGEKGLEDEEILLTEINWSSDFFTYRKLSTTKSRIIAMLSILVALELTKVK